jgi:hypothetical protein
MPGDSDDLPPAPTHCRNPRLYAICQRNLFALDGRSLFSGSDSLIELCDLDAVGQQAVSPLIIAPGYEGPHKLDGATDRRRSFVDSSWLRVAP